MKDEVDACVIFLTRIIQEHGQFRDDGKLRKFRRHLTNILTRKFENHWYTQVPSKGQAFRCIRINECERVDPVIEQAARQSGMNLEQLRLPPELTVWVDPFEVSCRFGESKGSLCTVARFSGPKKENYALSLDIEQELERHQQLKEIEEKKIRFQHNRSRLKTYQHNYSAAAVEFTANAWIPGPSWQIQQPGHHVDQGQYVYGW